MGTHTVSTPVLVAETPPQHTHTPAAATAALGHLHPIQLQQLAPNPPMPVAPVAGTWSLALAHSGQTLWLCRFNNLKDLIRRQDRLQRSRAELTQASALASPVVHAAGPFYILFCLLLTFSLQLPHRFAHSHTCEHPVPSGQHPH